MPTTESVLLPWSQRCDLLNGSIIDSSTSLLRRQKHDIVRFTIGSPAAEAIPVELLSELNGKICSLHGAEVFDYAATEGHPLLRAALVALFEIANAEGVAFIPGRALSASGGFSNALRLCFASTTPEPTAVGVWRLADGLRMRVGLTAGRVNPFLRFVIVGRAC